MIKIGIVGLGRIGLVHLTNIQHFIPNAVVVAACSGSEKSLAFAKKFGVPNRFTSMEQMLAEVEIDAVVLASPTSFHFEHLMYAISSQKHIFCEKPIDLSIQNELKSGQLILIEPPVELPSVDLNLVYHNRDYMPQRMKVFKEYLREELPKLL